MTHITDEWMDEMSDWQEDQKNENLGGDDMKKRLDSLKNEHRKLREDFALHLLGEGTTKSTAEKLGISTSRVRQIVDRRRRILQKEYFQKEKSREITEAQEQLARAVLMLHDCGKSEDEINEIFGYGYKCHGASKRWAESVLGA